MDSRYSIYSAYIAYSVYGAYIAYIHHKVTKLQGKKQAASIETDDDGEDNDRCYRLYRCYRHYRHYNTIGSQPSTINLRLAQIVEDHLYLGACEAAVVGAVAQGHELIEQTAAAVQVAVEHADSTLVLGTRTIHHSQLALGVGAHGGALIVIIKETRHKADRQKVSVLISWCKDTKNQ